MSSIPPVDLNVRYHSIESEIAAAGLDLFQSANFAPARLLVSKSRATRIGTGCWRFSALTMIWLLLTPLMLEAWEFKIDSALLDYRYLHYSQRGPAGFFGLYDIDMSSKNGDLAPLNGWTRRSMVAGSTSARSSTRMWLFPVLRLNKAVGIYGTYLVGPFNTEAAPLGRDPDTEPVISDGRWTRLWARIDTPLGRVFYGKRGFRQACGLQFGSGRTAEEMIESDRRTEEMLLMESGYGPFTFGLGFYPWRRGSEVYWNPEDHIAARVFHGMAYFKFVSASMETGCGGLYVKYGEGPEAQKTSAERASAPPCTMTATEGWIYLKYSNGGFFFNTEADWYFRIDRYQSSQDGTFFGDDPLIPGGGGSLLAPKYIDSWRYMVETGYFYGPWKLSLLLAHMPGPDRRHGILIDRQPYVQEADKSAFQVFYPYCILMAKVYGAGVNSFRDMSGANTIAVQLNYMLAGNLNLFASVMHARRSSHGYSWGYVRPNPSSTRFGFVDFSQRGTFLQPAPSIPDNDLGWELDLGLAWRLLENWDLFFRGAYWKPGRWFNYACVDKGVPNWDKPSPSNNFGISPDRTVDSVVGFEVYIKTRL